MPFSVFEMIWLTMALVSSSSSAVMVFGSGCALRLSSEALSASASPSDGVGCLAPSSFRISFYASC